MWMDIRWRRKWLFSNFICAFFQKPLSNLGLLYFCRMLRHTFKKSERLTSKKTFEQLFKSGKSIAVSPFRLVWMETNIVAGSNQLSVNGNQSTATDHRLPITDYCQLGISVPKKSFARAVDRNTLKRRIREAYRKNKHLLYEVLQNKNHTIALMIIYTAKEQLPYSEIEQKMVVSLQKMIVQIQ